MNLQFEYIFIERYPVQCCKEIELLWIPDEFNIASMPYPSPVGTYTQQTYHSHKKAVYYSNANKYYIYNSGNEWVVSTLTSLTIICHSNNCCNTSDNTIL